MPPGYVHLNMWKRFLPIVSIGFLSTLVISPELTLGLQLGYLSGYYIDPDLDQLSMTAGEGRILRRFKLLGAIFLGVWLPYAYLFKHRGISHWPIIGTASRWGYMSTIFLLAVRPDLEKVLSWLITNPMGWVGYFIGMAVSDLVHIGADFGWIKITRKDRRK